MKKLLASLKRFFCRHTFQTVAMYDQYTEKAYCPKCDSKYVVNKLYKWKFRLDEVSEMDYEKLRKEIQLFQEHNLRNE